MKLVGPYLPNGRVSEAAVCARACEVQADSEEDPDLWLWESVYFKHISKRKMNAYRGIVSDPTGWMSRMEMRGFKNPSLPMTRYPSAAQQEKALEKFMAGTWGCGGTAGKR